MNKAEAIMGAKNSVEFDVYRDFLLEQYSLGKMEPATNVENVDTVNGSYFVVTFTWSAIEKSADMVLTFDPDTNNVVDTEATVRERNDRTFSQTDYTLLDGTVREAVTQIDET